MILKLNNTPQETLAGGKNLGPEGGKIDNDYTPDNLANTNHLRSEFVLDILNGCDHGCDGCYVRRKADYNSQDLSDAIQISNAMSEMGIINEDLFLGPTDIFSALNFETMMADPLMPQLINEYSLSTSTTLMGDTSEIERKWRLLEYHLDNAPARDFLLIVSIDVEKYINNDPEYMETLTRNLQFFVNDTVVFIVNFTKNTFNDIKLVDLANKMTDDYNVALKIIPSFFRVGNPVFVAPTAKEFTEKLLTELPSEELPSNIIFQMFDKYFGGDGFMNVSYRNHELYITPFLFEGITQTNDIFKIPRDKNGNYTADIISQRFADITAQQYQYASLTNNCKDCNLLSSCISRHILAYMESRKIRNCIMPHDFIINPKQ